MKRYIVKSAFDVHGPDFGTLLTEDDGTLRSWHSADDRKDMFSEEIAFGFSMDNLLARYRTYAFVETERERAEDLELMVGRWRPMDYARETGAVNDWVVSHTGFDAAWVADAVQDIRFVIDRYITDDWTVISPPFAAHRANDPVYEALRGCLQDDAWNPPEDLQSLEPRELAQLLALDAAVPERYPIAWEADLLGDLLELRGEAAGSAPQRVVGPPEPEKLFKVLRAWTDAWTHDGPAVAYHVSRVGLERTFEDWLSRHLDILGTFGFPLQLVARQHRLASGRVADLICTITSDTDDLKTGDLVVIENKATMADVQALHQVLSYAEELQSKQGPGSRVAALLLADGVTIPLQERLYASGVAYVSLSALGYRDHLRGNPEPLVSEPDPVRATSTLVDHLPTTLGGARP